MCISLSLFASPVRRRYTLRFQHFNMYYISYINCMCVCVVASIRCGVSVYNGVTLCLAGWLAVVVDAADAVRWLAGWLLCWPRADCAMMCVRFAKGSITGFEMYITYVCAEFALCCSEQQCRGACSVSWRRQHYIFLVLPENCARDWIAALMLLLLLCACSRSHNIMPYNIYVVHLYRKDRRRSSSSTGDDGWAAAHGRTERTERPRRRSPTEA